MALGDDFENVDLRQSDEMDSDFSRNETKINSSEHDTNSENQKQKMI